MSSQDDVIRLVQIVGTLRFAQDVDTLLNVGLMTIQHTEECSEQGFACEFEGASEGPTTPEEQWPSLIVGTPHSPIPSQHTARIRLHYLEGMDKKMHRQSPAVPDGWRSTAVPLSRSWVKLGKDAQAGASQVTLCELPSGWRVGDEILVTATTRAGGSGSFRPGAKRSKEPQSESRRIAEIEGATVTLMSRSSSPTSG